MLEEGPILRVSNLDISLQIGPHPYKAVEDVSFDLKKGKTLAVVGESGCGKTLTALSLLRILPHPPALFPTGQILYHNVDLLKLSEREMRKIRGKKIAMIFQDPMSALNPVYTIGNQLMEVAQLHLDLYDEEAYERCEQSLREVGIPSPGNSLQSYPHQLSGGMKQRVMIAMALMCEPDILIADEPTTALDVTIQAQVLELIRALQTRKNTALLLISHDLGVVAEMADEVIIMYAGQMIERGSVEQIFDHQAHPYTMGLFASRPSLDKSPGQLQPIKGMVPSITHYPKGCRFHPRCPYAMDICKHGDVANFKVASEPNHTAHCWLLKESNGKLCNQLLVDDLKE